MSALDMLLEDMMEQLSVAPPPPQPPTHTPPSHVTPTPPQPARAEHTRQQQSTTTTPARAYYTQQRIYRFAAKDGPQHVWCFVRGTKSSDANVAAFQYHLQRVDKASGSSNSYYYGNRGGSDNAWIQEFSPSFIEDIGKDVSLAEDARLKLKASVGKCHFLLRRMDPIRKLDWRALQRLAVKRDFVSRWSNICDQSDVRMSALIRELEGKLDPSDVTFKEVLTVHVKTPVKGNECRLKYHRVDGQWELLERNSIAKVLATYDVLMDNAVAFRVRVSAKLPGQEEVFDAMVRHVKIDTPPGGDLFDTTVTLSSGALRGYHIESFALQRKTYVVHGGMRFILAYLDRDNTELRLECRLVRPHEENNKATDGGNESVDKQQNDPDEDSSVHAQCQRLVRRLLAAIERP